MAARRSPVVVLLLLLLLLLPLVASSSPILLRYDGSVYPVGHFYVSIGIGDPPRPYFLDIDTGSSLTWLQCKPCISCNKVPHMQTMYQSTPDKLVPCTDQLCIDLHRDLGNPPNTCSKEGKCAYKITYADGMSEGVLIGGDRFALPRSGARRPLLAFGCGHDQHVGRNFQVPSPVDGLLGLGKGSVDLVSQLKNHGVITKNAIGHCISIRGGGFLLVGVDRPPPPGITWVPMVQSREHHHYSPGLAELYFDGNPLGVNPLEVVFDSGSTYTYLDAQPYKATLSAVRGALGDELTPVRDPALPVCWKGRRPFRSVADVKTFFKPLSLVFQHDTNKAMEIPPENYLIISKGGNACLGILDGSALPLDGMSIIGDIAMQDQFVIYDNEGSRLGWVRYTRCDQMPNNFEFGITSRL